MKNTNPNPYRLSPQQKINEEETNARTSVDRLLVAAREMGDMPWDSDPDQTIEFLRHINETRGLKIPINRDDIAEKLKKNDDRLKEKMRSSYQEPPPATAKRTKFSSSSPLSVLEPTTSHSSGEDDSGIPAVAPGGGAPVLFCKRSLTASDVDDTQNRLSLPCSQVKSMSFFTEEERRKLGNGRSGVEVNVLVPENNTRYRVSMKKTMIGSSGSYTINKPWNDIKKQNEFKKDMKFEIRGYRDEEDHVCLVFERVNN